MSSGNWKIERGVGGKEKMRFNLNMNSLVKIYWKVLAVV